MSAEITFKTITQEVFKFTLPLSTTVAEIKQKIAEDKGADFEVERQKLIYNGKVLEDGQILDDIKVDEKKYIVVMVSRKKVEQPAAAQTSNVETAKAATPTPATESSSSAAVETAPAVAQPSAPTSDISLSPEQEASISLIQGMGYPRDEIVKALRAAFWNADRAVEYLCNGIPETGDAIEDNLNEALMDQDIGDDDHPLAFLRDSPQFAQICQIVRNQPDMLPQVLNQISSSNPDLMQIIRDNQDTFVQMLNEHNIATGGQIGEDVGEAADQGSHQAGHMTISITEADRNAIQRLQAMGFPEQLVIEAYFACEKNEDLAVNYILSRIEEVTGEND